MVIETIVYDICYFRTKLSVFPDPLDCQSIPYNILPVTLGLFKKKSLYGGLYAEELYNSIYCPTNTLLYSGIPVFIYLKLLYLKYFPSSSFELLIIEIIIFPVQGKKTPRGSLRRQPSFLARV